MAPPMTVIGDKSSLVDSYTPASAPAKTQIYKVYQDADGNSLASHIYAIKDGNGDMIPVHFSPGDQGYVAMTAGEIGALPNLPEYPVPASVKIYETYYNIVAGVFTDNPVGNNNMQNTVIHAYKEADGSMVPVFTDLRINMKCMPAIAIFILPSISINNAPDLQRTGI